MGCNLPQGDEICIEICLESLKERNHSEDQNADESIILKRVLGTYN
jgi:hypothetical protein